MLVTGLPAGSSVRLTFQLEGPYVWSAVWGRPKSPYITSRMTRSWLALCSLPDLQIATVSVSMNGYIITLMASGGRQAKLTYGICDETTTWYINLTHGHWTVAHLLDIKQAFVLVVSEMLNATGTPGPWEHQADGDYGVTATLTIV